jgi:hypothetical protein
MISGAGVFAVAFAASFGDGLAGFAGALRTVLWGFFAFMVAYFPDGYNHHTAG